jgi:hypothetical protein
MQLREVCELNGLDPETSYMMRLQTTCLDDTANSYISEPFHVYSLHDAVLHGGIRVYGVRRLAESTDSDVPTIIETVRNTIAMLLSVALTKVAVSRDQASIAIPDGTLHLGFTVAIAQVMLEINLLEAEETAHNLLGIMSGRFNTTSGNFTFAGAISHYIGQGVTVEMTSKPTLQVLDGLLPACSAPRAINLMSPDWSPKSCAGRDWHSDLCVVPCRTGYWSDGAYECNVDATWEGSPRCVPEWAVGVWSTCNSTCGPGMQLREVWCPAGDGCERARPTDQQHCYATASCEWQVEAWTACSTECGIGLHTRSVTCSSAVKLIARSQGQRAAILVKTTQTVIGSSRLGARAAIDVAQAPIPGVCGARRTISHIADNLHR